jgi:two-component system cell cycle sensor histidine kinase/response regulator CckA
VLGDDVQFEQVFMNLAINARDAMPEGGTIKITTSDVELGEVLAGALGLRGGRFVLIRVEDDGSGIHPEHLPRIFEPFFSTKDPTRGSGLGLSTAFGIVRECGGTIQVSSELDEGTCFEIYLPVAEPQEPQTREPAARVEAEERPSGVILVVDDESSVRALMVSTLRANGYQVVHAADGEAALEVIESMDSPPDLVVCDVVMPRLSGPDLRQRLLESCPKTPFLFTSGYSRESHADLAKIGRTDFLPKPFHLAQFLDAVRLQLSR